MSQKITPCKGGARHKWRFVKNRTVTSYHGCIGSAHISLKGWYRCEFCAVGKYGNPGHEEPTP